MTNIAMNQQTNYIQNVTGKQRYHACGLATILPTRIKLYAIARRQLKVVVDTVQSLFTIAYQEDFRCRSEQGLRCEKMPRAPAATQETCARCRGTGHVRERGQRLICKACAGTGRVTVAAIG